ncbi:MAG: hypothetical protein JWL76_1905 [Thermoleophilia bacterium]|nr:hypothetical protein [Thermoleophilia bacterium]
MTDDENPLVGARLLMLESSASELGFADAGDEPWGVAIDIGFDAEAAATVISLKDGTTSLYTTTGGGIVGGGEHEAVSAASRGLVESAARHVEDVLPRADTDLPGAGNVTIWLRIGDERFGRTVPEAELMSGESPLATLYATGHGVITQLRLLDDARG